MLIPPSVGTVLVLATVIIRYDALRLISGLLSP